MGKRISIVAKNGNFNSAHETEEKAVAAMRKLAGDDLEVKGIATLPASEKNGVVTITGVPHWRVKNVPLA